MRRSLLNKPNLLKSLRQALVLFTLLILPSAAWGQDPVITIAGDAPDPTTGVINSDNISGGTVTFDSSNNTLTLNNATIAGTVFLLSELENLTIHLVGENKINGAGYGTELGNGIKIVDGITPGALTFTTDGNNPGNLFFPYVTTPIEGFTNIVYKNGLAWGCDSYTEGGNTCTHFYQGVGTNVVIASVAWNACITKGNTTITTTTQGTIVYSYQNGENILTLSNITDYNNSIVWYSPDDVTFEIDGDNSFVFDTNSPKIVGNSQSNITFAKKNTSTTATLRFWHKGTGIDFVNINEPYISGFKNAGNPNLGEGLYHIDLVDTRKFDGNNTDFTEHYITTEAYDLTVGDIRVHNISALYKGYKDHILGEKSDDVFDETVKFTPADNSNLTPATLTLNGANIEYASGNVIVSTLTTPLEVIISGNSNIYSGSHLPFEGATGGNANLVFKKLGENPTLVMTSSQNGFSPTSFYTGFNEVSYDGNQLYAYLSENNVVIEQVTPYGLTVAGVAVTNANCEDILDGDNGKVSFTPAKEAENIPATLTLTDATLDGSIESSLDNLTISLVGANSLNGSISYNGSNDGYLAFTGEGSLAISNSDGVINGFSDVDFDSDSGSFNLVSTSQGVINYNTEDKNLQVGEDLVSNVTITKETFYPIWVKGILVTEINKSDVLGDGDGSVMFDSSENRLSLKGATIDCSETYDVVPVISTIKELELYVYGGRNTIKIYSGKAFKYVGAETGATLTFSTVDPSGSDYENLGLLKIEGTNSNDVAEGYTVKGEVGNSTVSIGEWPVETNTGYSGWKCYFESGQNPSISLFYREVYDLWLNSTRFYYNNPNTGFYSYGLNPFEGAVFDPTSSTLTFSYFSGSSYHLYSGLSDLTISIRGETELEAISFGSPNQGNLPISETSGELTIKKDEKSTVSVNKLTLANNDGGVITGFENVTIHESMNLLKPNSVPTTWNEEIKEAIFTDEEVYDLWVKGIRVTSGNASKIIYVTNPQTEEETTTVIFDAENNILTLNNATIEAAAGTNGIESKLSELTVHIVGINAISAGGSTDDAAFKGTGTNAIAFTFDGSSSSLFIQSFNPISGLTATFEDGYGLTSVSPEAHYLEHLVSPYFSSASADNGITVTLNKPHSETEEDLNYKYKDATIYYSITYANEADNVEDAEYTTSFSMTKPGTVTAYLTLEEERGQSEDVIGKYYGYPDAPYTIGAGNDVSPDIYPNIVDGEYIGFYDGGYSSNNETIATFAAGKITAKEPGTTTLTATLSGSDMAFTVLNPYDPTNSSHYPITFSVIVGENLDNLFAANQNFGTWYNTSDKTYKVPDGITAYIITGVDGDKVTIAETKVIPPNAPILMEKGENAKAFTYTEATDTDGSFPSGNILNYTTTDKEAVEASKLYVLYNGQFVKVTAGTKILANHCYLDLGGTSAGTRGFYNIGDGEGTTAIREVIYEGVNSEKLADGEWYTLQGQRVAKPAKGLYIRNGKKVVVK